jgi:hypothetical protein
MAKSIRVPSLQHMARNCRADPDLVARQLIQNVERPPPFSCECLNVVARELVMLNTPIHQLQEYVRRAEPRLRFQGFLLETIPLLYDHLKGLSTDYFQDCAPRHYDIAPDIRIPFRPQFIYGIGGQKHVPHFSFWRSNPLEEKSLSLFVTIVDEIFLNDPDLEDARFHIVDLSRPKGEDERRLRLIDAREVPRLDEREKRTMLEIFADGYRLARDELAGSKPAKAERDEARRPDPNQGDLFNPDTDQ